MSEPSVESMKAAEAFVDSELFNHGDEEFKNGTLLATYTNRAEFIKCLAIRLDAARREQREADAKRLLPTPSEARFIVRVMDTLVQHPSMLANDLIAPRKELGVLYEKHGRWTEGSERGRAEWLINHLAALRAGDEVHGSDAQGKEGENGQ